MSVTAASLAPVLKDWYHGQRTEDLCFQSRPLLDLLTKDPGGGGLGDVMTTRVSAPKGFGNTFSGSQGLDSGSDFVRFQMTYGELYGTISFTHRALKTAEKDVHTFMKAKKEETDAMLNAQGNIMAYQAWGNGGGSIGKRGSISTNTVTLSNPQDAHNFEKGMTIVASDGDGSSSGDSLRSGSTTVASVDRAAGTVTLVSAAAISSFANDDFLFRSGIFSGDVTQVLVMQGIESWLPASAPTSTAFFGVDRTIDDRLSGYRSPVTGQGLEGLLRQTAAQHNARMDGEAKDGFLHPERWESLSRVLQNQGVRIVTQKNEKGTFGYSALEQTAPYGVVKWKADRFCPVGHAFFLDLRNLKLQSIGNSVHWMEEDGNRMLRKDTSAAYEMRSVSMCNIASKNPSAHARVPLPAL